MASRPESPRSERFSVWFAAADDCELPADHGASPDGFYRAVVQVLRNAATQRNDAQRSASAKLWIAEMRVDPELAEEIGERFESFFGSLPERADGAGALTYAIIPAAGRGDGTPGS